VAGTSPTSGIGVLTTRGDLLTFDAVNVRIPIGFDGQVLSVVGGLPTWVNPTTPLVGIGLLDDGSVALIDDSGAGLVSD